MSQKRHFSWYAFETSQERRLFWDVSERPLRKSCLYNIFGFLVQYFKNIQSKKLCNLLLNNVDNVSKTTHDPDKVIFNFSSYRLNNHEKSLLCKGLNFAIPPKNIKYSDYFLPFELLFRDVNSSNFWRFDKECVKSRLRDCAYSSFKQVSKISDKNLLDGEIKALKNLIENKGLVMLLWF